MINNIFDFEFVFDLLMSFLFVKFTLHSDGIIQHGVSKVFPTAVISYTGDAKQYHKLIERYIGTYR